MVVTQPQGNTARLGDETEGWFKPGDSVVGRRRWRSSKEWTPSERLGSEDSRVEPGQAIDLGLGMATIAIEPTNRWI